MEIHGDFLEGDRFWSKATGFVQGPRTGYTSVHVLCAGWRGSGTKYAGARGFLGFADKTLGSILASLGRLVVCNCSCQRGPTFQEQYVRILSLWRSEILTTSPEARIGSDKTRLRLVLR
jgi:hypothetical protein